MKKTLWWHSSTGKTHFLISLYFDALRFDSIPFESACARCFCRFRSIRWTLFVQFKIPAEAVNYRETALWHRDWISGVFILAVIHKQWCVFQHLLHLASPFARASIINNHHHTSLSLVCLDFFNKLTASTRGESKISSDNRQGLRNEWCMQSTHRLLNPARFTLFDVSDWKESVASSTSRSWCHTGVQCNSTGNPIEKLEMKTLIWRFKTGGAFASLSNAIVASKVPAINRQIKGI